MLQYRPKGAALDSCNTTPSRYPMTTTIPEPPRRRSIALIASPIGLLLISAARLIIVSNYNTTTAVTIAASGGYVNTLLGSIIPLIPVFAPYLALILLLFRRFILSVIVFIFAAFITPAAVQPRALLSLARSDWHHLLQLVPHSQMFVAIGILLISVAVIGPLWSHHRELAEVAGAAILIFVIAALFLTTPSEESSLPIRLQSAAMGETENEHRLINFAFENWVIIIAIGLSIVALISAYSNYPRLLSAAVAIIVTIALLPYVSGVYPVPHQGSYYYDVLHELWLPAERIVTNSGHVYYGYILSSEPDWDTVLKTDRTIVYLRAEDIVRRSVCRPKTTPQPAPYKPLIPFLYTKPAFTPPCARVPAPIPTVPSLVSHGQSLKAISLMVGTWPWRVIVLTNAVERNHLSSALRAYEEAHNWFAPTTIGQRFWYPPHLAPAAKSHGPRQVPRAFVPHACNLRPVC
jgi:hypothetical protein